MTALEACDVIEGAINDLHEETRNSPWEWSYTEELSDEAHLENFRQTLAKTRAHFDIPDQTSIWFVSTKDDAILATCGNSPTAKARAKYMCCVHPQNVSFLIERIRELEAK